MIDKRHLQGQLDSLDAQERQLLGQLHEVRGAQRMVRHLLGQLERAEDAVRQEHGAGNGVAPAAGS